MKTRNFAIALVAGTCLATVAQAQVSFTLEKAVDMLDVIATTPADFSNPLKIGSSISAVALNGNRLYVVGWNAVSGDTATSRKLPVVQVDDWTVPVEAKRIFPDGSVSSQLQIPRGRGYSGLDYLPGAGLAVSGDYNGSFVSGDDGLGQYMTFDVDTQINPILKARAVGTSSPMGKAGTAWDAGVDGLGFTYAGGSGPIVAALAQNVTNQGPLGLNPLTLDAGVGATVYEPGLGGPIISGAPLQSTLYRDIDIHPTNGTIAARGGANVIVAPRIDNATVDTAARVVFNLGTGNGGAGAPFSAGQNIQILNGLTDINGAPVADLVVFNSRYIESNTQALSTVVKFADFQGNTVSVALNGQFDPDRGGPATPINVVDGIGNGFYDFSWDPANKRLAISDFVRHWVYIFKLDVNTANPCPADFNGDTFVDDTDFVTFAAAYEAFLCPGAPGCDGDFNNDGFVDDFDFVIFAAAYEAFVCP